ncbi:permease [Rhizobium sp. rho-13.1]|nr:permease [Rhizobium sp. B209b/85]QXZ98487.1 permease [Rhizobium sp. B230/85]QYA04590.1 permease [Rhizobium sp. B21/90]TQX86027.1 permease [Rhizobium sp. rho-13.1]TQY10991.1 permease [Rhizobium sp. rho-1.1]
MDFMKLLKSLEELLYELVSWLVFYPLTMWRSVVRPLTMMRYADAELTDEPADQYEDTLSPPLFLLITLLLSQCLSAAFPSIYDTATAAKELGSGSNLLIARGVVFGIYPLCMAVTALRHQSTKITRNSLRPPFFSQCYVAAPFAFMIGLAFDFMFMPHEQGLTIGVLTIASATLWYAQAQVRWLMQDLKIGTLRATGAFVIAFVSASVVALVLAVTIALEAKNIAAS